MNLFLHILFVFAFFFLVTPQESAMAVKLGIPYQQTLGPERSTAIYVFQITENDVPKDAKWFFFMEIEPDEKQEWTRTSIQLSIKKPNVPEKVVLKRCAVDKAGVESCFLTNKDFNYKEDQIYAILHCLSREKGCKFNISAEVSAPYKSYPGQTIKMDFENTAYSKIFTIDTSSYTFDQLRITLRPEGFLAVPAPIGLYANFGPTIPTSEHHDIKGMTLWDDGLGIFLSKPQRPLLTILVEGPQKNILLFKSELIDANTEGNLTQSSPFFDFLRSEELKFYRMGVDVTKTNCLRITTLSGSIELEGLYDVEGKNKYPIHFKTLNHTFGELQYQFTSEYLKALSSSLITSLKLRIKAKKRSTFILEPFFKDENVTFLMPELTKYVDVPAGGSDQYYLKLVETMDNPAFTEASFEILVTTPAYPALRFKFFQCNKPIDSSCFLTSTQAASGTQSFPQMTSVKTYQEIAEIDGVRGFSFRVAPSKFKQIENSTVRKYVLSIGVSNTGKQEAVYSIQFLNAGKNIYLKENEIRKDRLFLGENKHYIYTNQDPDIKEIRVHIVRISGRIHLEGFKADPRVDTTQSNPIQEHRSTLAFAGINPGKSIYVRVKGIERAYYSLSLQLIRTSEESWSNQSKNHNEIMLYEDIHYEFIVPAKTKQAYRMFLKQDVFELRIRALLPLFFCLTEEMSRAPFEPNCEVRQNLTRTIVDEIKMDRGLVGLVGVTNNNQKDVKFEIFFSSSPTTFCHLSPLGKVLSFDTNINERCIGFFLSKREDLQVIVELASKDYNTSKVELIVGENEKIIMTSPMHIFKKEELNKICEESPICVLKIKLAVISESQADIIVQYLSQHVTLIDGIALSFHGHIDKRKFIYKIINQAPITIIVENKRGSFKFYGKIVEQEDAYNLNPPTLADATITSTNPFFYEFQVAVVTVEQIKKANCTSCVVLISVESIYESQNSKFTIECTQQNRFLKENQEMVSYLPKNSFAFYEFYNPANGSIIVRVNSQFKECVDIYSRYNNSYRATGSEYDQKGSANRLYVEDAKSGPYSLTLLAKQDCPYTIEVVTSSKKFLSILGKGTLKDIRLSAGQSINLLYQNNQVDAIKFLALRESGEIMIRAKNISSIKDAINLDFNSTIDYPWAGINFLKISPTEKGYCTKCVFLLEITSQFSAIFSLAVGAQRYGFPIMMNNAVKDELLSGQVEIYRVNGYDLSQFQVDVIYGIVNVTVVAMDSNQMPIGTDFSNVFSAANSTSYNKFTIPKIEPIIGQFGSFKSITIKAMANSSYILSVISEDQASNRSGRVKLGIPEYLVLKENYKHCFKGTIDDPTQQFLISASRYSVEENEILSKIKVELTVRNTLIQLAQSIGKNEMFFVPVKFQEKTPADYQFCLVCPTSIFINFLQSSNVNYFDEGVPFFVRTELNLTFYSEGNVILEINQCESRALTTVSQSFNTLAEMSSVIPQVRKGNNIVQFSYFGPVFIHVMAKSATILWRHKNETSGQGAGYDEYSSGKLRIHTDQSQFIISITPPVKTEGKWKRVVKKYVYEVQVAADEMQLYSLLNCGAKNNFHTSFTHLPGAEKLESVRFNIDKIIDEFRGKEYIMVGVLVKVEASIGNITETYRLSYPYQQIPMNLLVPEQQKEEQTQQPSSGPSLILALTIFLIIGILAFAIYTKWVKKCLREKRSMLNEEGSTDVKYKEFVTYS